jgi:hypothetical protein
MGEERSGKSFPLMRPGGRADGFGLGVTINKTAARKEVNDFLARQGFFNFFSEENFYRFVLILPDEKNGQRPLSYVELRRLIHPPSSQNSLNSLDPYYISVDNLSSDIVDIFERSGKKDENQIPVGAPVMVLFSPALAPKSAFMDTAKKIHYIPIAFDPQAMPPETLSFWKIPETRGIDEWVCLLSIQYPQYFSEVRVLSGWPSAL